MSVITFCAISDNGTTVDYSFQPDTWYDALDHFVKFLRAQGYRIEDDSILINTSNGHCVCEDQIPELNNIGFIDLDETLGLKE